MPRELQQFFEAVLKRLTELTLQLPAWVAHSTIELRLHGRGKMRMQEERIHRFSPRPIFSSLDDDQDEIYHRSLCASSHS
jgi:hypothetical protein